MRVLTLLVVFLLISISPPLAEEASAQAATAAVELTCTPPYASGAIDVDVYPGASLSGYTECTVSNPTMHTEKIEITVQSDGLAAAAPGSISVAAGSEADFQVTVRADAQMSASSRTITVTARVTEMSGVPPPNVAESTVQNIINIKQFAQFNVAIDQPLIEIATGETVNLEYMLFNEGNGHDRFNIEVDYVEIDDMQTSLPLVRLEVDRRSISIFRMDVKAPTDGSMWTIDSNGRHTAEVDIEIKVTSDFSCRTTGCLDMVVIQKIVFYENQSYDNSNSDILSSSVDDNMLVYGGGGVGLVLLLILFMTLRKRKN